MDYVNEKVNDLFEKIAKEKGLIGGDTTPKQENTISEFKEVIKQYIQQNKMSINLSERLDDNNCTVEIKSYYEKRKHIKFVWYIDYVGRLEYIQYENYHYIDITPYSDNKKVDVLSKFEDILLFEYEEVELLEGVKDILIYNVFYNYDLENDIKQFFNN